MEDKEYRELSKCFQRVFDCEDGKRVLKYLEDKYYHLSPLRLNKGQLDPLLLALREGQRVVVNKIRKLISEELDD